MKKFIFVVFLLMGCNEKTYTVDDFKKNDDLRKEFLHKCKNGEIHPQELNCINVKRAQIEIRAHNFKSPW